MSDLTRELSPAKTYISASEQWQWSYELAKRIYESGWHPDVIIGLYRGGIVPAIVIEDYLRSKGIKTFHFPLHAYSYDPDKAESIPGEVQVYDFPEYVKRAYLYGPRWSKVLVVDDICDTGNTFAAIENAFVKNLYGLQEAYDFDRRRAALAWKPEKHATFRPNWWMKEYSNDTWVVFPHEFCGIDIEEKLKAEAKEKDNGH